MARPNPYRTLETADDPELRKLLAVEARCAAQLDATAAELTAATDHRRQLPDQLADAGATAAIDGTEPPKVREAIADADARLTAAEVEADAARRALARARTTIEDYIAEHGDRLRDEHAELLAGLRDAAAEAATTAGERLDAYAEALIFHQALTAVRPRLVVAGHRRGAAEALVAERSQLADTRETLGPIRTELRRSATSLAGLPPHPEPEADDDAPLIATGGEQ